MEKKSFKSKHSIKEKDLSLKENFEILTEKYSKMKDIMKEVLKERDELKRRHMQLRAEHEELKFEMEEKETLIQRMQSVSEAVIDEYNALKVKCDLEAEAATNASKRATKYFQENQKLKESKNELEDNQIDNSIELSSQEPNLGESVSEQDMLNNLASELRTEIATLKVQLTKEIEKQSSLKEDFEIAKDLYEKEMKEHNVTRDQLKATEFWIDNRFNKSDKSSLETYVEQSTTILKQEQDSNSKDSLYAKNATDVNLELEEIGKQNNLLNARIQELELENRKLRAEASASMSVPIPPPPPPPPLPPPPFNPIKSFITFMHAGKKSAKIKKENVETQQQKAMSQMIDAIKKGQVHLKPTPKANPSQSPKEEESAMCEMKNILTTLKKKDRLIQGGACDAVQGAKCLDESFVEEAPGNVPIASGVDEELKVLLRKRSLKSITDENACAMSVAELKSNSSNDDPIDHQRECHISASNNGRNQNDHLVEIVEESHVSPLFDSVITSENQNLEDTVKVKFDSDSVVES